MPRLEVLSGEGRLRLLLHWLRVLVCEVIDTGLVLFLEALGGPVVLKLELLLRLLGQVGSSIGRLVFLALLSYLREACNHHALLDA